ncbi:MAG: glycosyltransferase family 2 protein [Acidobacteria bacterium]|nr:glycosyltransferase family 2 protein [Acidobacteriota bacterium]
MTSRSAAPVGPRVVFGMPAYRRPDALARVLESLLSQTCPDFAIVIVDDDPSPEVKAIVETYAEGEPRIVYEPNPVRLGMIGNWRKAFDHSRALYPSSEYFAWVSDHDMWHPRWLEAMVDGLDGHPAAVMAYSQMQRVFPHERRAVTRRFDTVGLPPAARLRAATSEMTAGNCIYGLFRAAALEQAGVFRPVLMPDRQVLLALCLLGEFRHIPEVLWYREVAGMFSFSRQRRMLFADRVPLHTYLPANVQHFGVLLWDFAVRGRGRPAIGRLAGVRYAVLQLAYSVRRELTRDDAEWRTLFGRVAADVDAAR